MTSSRNIDTLERQPSGQAISANNIFKNRKVFNDPIHGHIALHPVCVRIIDTPQFQRLRHIKQLDACYMVYPGASHNRFEHSLGVCYLAGKLIKALRKRQPDENITERDILCVETAGLCHDLGQGPFSHVFEQRFMPRIEKQRFTHEGAAVKMFKYMLGVNDGKVKEDIQKIIGDCNIPDFDRFEENDFTFIEELIGDPKNLKIGEWPYKGRGEDKSFMYEIVANSRNGIDVDKWDYIARDSYMLGMKVSFDHNRCLTSARVIKGNGEHGTNGVSAAEQNQTTTQNNGENGSAERDADQSGNVAVFRKQICYREKVAQDLYDMFYTRMTLHKRAYQHRVHNVIGMMVCDALIAANGSKLRIKGFKISETVDHMDAYTHLNDEVFELIRNSGNEDLSRAKEILDDILNRKFYKFIAERHFTSMGEKLKELDFKEGFEKYLRRENQPVPEDFIYVDIVNLDCGFKTKDPMENVRFYNKMDLGKSFKLRRNQVSFVLSDTFAEQIIRLYCNIPVSDGDEENDRMKWVEKAFSDYVTKELNPKPTMSRQTGLNDDTNIANAQGNTDEDLTEKRMPEPPTVTEQQEEQPPSFDLDEAEVQRRSLPTDT